MNSAYTAGSLIIEQALLASRLSKRIGLRLSSHGVSLSEYLLMEFLGRYCERAVPRAELADHLSMSASGVTRMLAPMEKIGLIHRQANERDGRQSLVVLSEAGKRILEEARVTLEETARELLKPLTDENAEVFLDLCNKLA